MARNRRKRTDQKVPSLHGWFQEMEKQYGRQAARQTQSRLTVAKGARRYNNPDRLLPGAVFLYEGKQYVMAGQLIGGAYLRAYEAGNQNFPASRESILSRNAGLVYVA